MNCEEQVRAEITQAMKPFMETVGIVSQYYVARCNRNAITDNDVELALKYVARSTEIPLEMMLRHLSTYTVPRQDAFDSDKFSLFRGDDDLMELIHQAYDYWDEWDPPSFQMMLIKNAVNSTTFPEII